MSVPSNGSRRFSHLVVTLSCVLVDFAQLLVLVFRSPRALAAENLFVRKRLALFQDRQVEPRRADDATRWIMARSEPVV
jgi:hypothetical protein